MSNKIVITMYGTGKAVNDFTVTLFEKENDYGEDKADDYCSIINGLKLKDDNWIYAFKVKENQKYTIKDPRESNFEDIISALDNMSIQKVLREVDIQELEKALKSANKETLKAILRNMSKRAARMLIEDMEYMGPIRLKDVYEARRKIISIIRHLEDTGEIIVRKSSQDEMV